MLAKLKNLCNKFHSFFNVIHNTYVRYSYHRPKDDHDYYTLLKTLKKVEITKLDDFFKIDAIGCFNIKLSQGNICTLSIEATNEQHKNIIVNSSDGTLNLSATNNLWKNNINPVNVYIVLKDLSSIEISGACLVESEEIKVKQLSLCVSGISDAKLNLEAEKLAAYCDGTSSIKLIGNCNDSSFNVTGTSKLQASDFISKNSFIHIDGVSKAIVYATDKITINAHGISNVKYIGNPRVTEVKTYGVSKVSRI